jgi:hypothetical protein
MFKQMAVARTGVQETYEHGAKPLDFRLKAIGWSRNGINIHYLPSSFSDMIRAIVGGKTFVKAETSSSFEFLKFHRAFELHLGYSADESEQRRIDGVVRAEDEFDKWGIRPPPGAIEAIFAEAGWPVPELNNIDEAIDWPAVYNSIRETEDNDEV